ncbi:MAG: hypothetical protein Q9162_002207 [Coniocarpon cinnabarinum]
MDLVNQYGRQGRLNTATLDLLAGSDIQFTRHNRLDIALVKNLPIALIFLPAADIPFFVGEGRVDLGITGWDQVAEYEAGTPPTPTSGAETVMDLGFGKCALQVQTPRDRPYEHPSSLIGKNVVTSFTNLSEQYFRKLEKEHSTDRNGLAEVTDGKLRTKLHFASGSVEAACALGVADGIVDLVGKHNLPSAGYGARRAKWVLESGETMRAAGLRAIDTVVSSTAVLVKSKHPSDPTMVNLIASRIRGVITAQSYVLCTYNIRRADKEAAMKITPGKRAPTITSLEDSDWVAVNAMVLRQTMAVTMDRLADIGAEDIIITKVENTRTA